MQLAFDLAWFPHKGAAVDSFTRDQWVAQLASERHVPLDKDVKISYIRSGDRIVVMLATEDGMSFYDAVVTRQAHIGSA